MGTLAFGSFEGQTPSECGWIVSAGPDTSKTDSLPGLPDEATRSFGGSSGPGQAYRPFYLNTNRSLRVAPAGLNWWFGAQFVNGRTDNTDGASFALSHYHGVSFEAAPMIGVSLGDDEYLNLKIGTVLAATSTHGVGVGVWKRFAVEVTGVTEGDTINVYVNGDHSTAIISHTITAGEAATLAALNGGVPTAFITKTRQFDGAGRACSFWFFDPNDGVLPATDQFYRSVGVRFIAITGDGVLDEGTGDYTDVNTVPVDHASAYVFASSGLNATFTQTALGDVASLLGVNIHTHIVSDGQAGTQVRVGTRDAATGGSDNTTLQPAPGDGPTTTLVRSTTTGALTGANFDLDEIAVGSA